jgi:hypothetical protein
MKYLIFILSFLYCDTYVSQLLLFCKQQTTIINSCSLLPFNVIVCLHKNRKEIIESKKILGNVIYYGHVFH